MPRISNPYSNWDISGHFSVVQGVSGPFSVQHYRIASTESVEFSTDYPPEPITADPSFVIRTATRIPHMRVRMEVFVDPLGLGAPQPFWFRKEEAVLLGKVMRTVKTRKPETAARVANILKILESVDFA